MTEPAATEPSRDSILDPVAAHARAHPDRPLLVTPERTVTWGEFDVLARRVAHSLPAGSDRPPVVVVCEDEVDFQVAQWGAIVAGRAAVVVHPSEPPARVAAIVSESGADAVIVSAGQEAGVPGVAVVRMDDLASAEPWSAAVSPDDLSLVQFTSGSTGVPKGVAHSHRSLLAESVVYAREVGIVPDDRVILLNRAASLDTFGALLVGATVYPYDAKRRGTVDLPRWVAEAEVSVFRSTPSLLRAFGARVGAHRPAGVRIVVQGGEVLTPADVALVRRVFPPRTSLLHIYGTSETGVATAGIVDDALAALPAIPVGSAVAGMQVAILDRNGIPVSGGQIGVVAVSGVALAAGYVGRPDLTAERFRGTGAGRHFVTGDLGRFDDAGRLVLEGRDDRQVKIRGFRVELDEVEAALRRVPGVAEAAVVTRPDATGGMRLVGYHRSESGTPATSRSLREAMGRDLPDHLVPSLFVAVDEFPLASHGKVDRDRLPDPREHRPEGDIAATGMPARMAALWQDLLGVGAVGLDDSFFDLGGDSLAAAALLAAVEEEFGVRVPMADLFDVETLGEMCAVVAAADHDTGPGLLVPLQRSGDLPPLYCVHLPGWSEGVFRPLARQIDRRRPMIGILEEPPPDWPRDRTFADLADRYAQAVSDAAAGDPILLLGHSGSGILAAEMARQLLARGTTVAWLGIIDSAIPGASSGPIARVLGIPERWRQAVQRRGGAGAVARLAVSRLAGEAAARRRSQRRILAAYRRHRLGSLTGIPTTYFLATGGGAVTGAAEHWRDRGATVVPVGGVHTGPGSVMSDDHATELARAIEQALARAVG